MRVTNSSHITEDKIADMTNSKNGMFLYVIFFTRTDSNSVRVADTEWLRRCYGLDDMALALRTCLWSLAMAYPSLGLALKTCPWPGLDLFRKLRSCIGCFAYGRF